MIETAIAYISTMDPGFTKRIKGVSKDDIASFEAMSGRKLPKAYVEFLEAMGLDFGGLDFTPDCVMDFKAIFELYRTEILTGQSPAPEDALVIGAYGMALPSLYLKPLDVDDPGVYAETDDYDLYAESLGNMICHTGFYTYQLPAFGNRVTLHKSDDTESIMEKATQIVMKAGYSALLFSDKARHCLVSEKAGIGIQDIASLGRMITIGYRDETEVQKLIEELQQEFQFKIMRR
jgi:SMI1/KNR4 family protein SUKH-1